MDMLKVKFDWSKSKFQQAANVVNAQAAGKLSYFSLTLMLIDCCPIAYEAAAAAAAASANRGVQPSTSAQLVVPSAVSLSTNPVYFQPSPVKQTPAPISMAQTSVINNGGGNFVPSVGLDDDLTSSSRPFGSVGSAFTSTASAGPASGATQTCCLTEEGQRCSRSAGNASYSKRIQKTVQQKRLRLSIDPSARHIYICEHHKSKLPPIF